MKKMITRRNFLKAAGVSAAALGLAACGGSGSSTAASSTAGSAAASAAASDWTWERKVTLVCPWGVGGGADGTLRPLQPVLEPILGVPVEIVNVEGAGGANGIDFTCKQPADGYTYVLGTQSHIMLDLQKILPVDFKKELRPVAKLVHSINIIASSKKAQEGKYSNFTEFVDYAKAHPQELTCGMLTATGADSVALKQTLAGALAVTLPKWSSTLRSSTTAPALSCPVPWSAAISTSTSPVPMRSWASSSPATSSR